MRTGTAALAVVVAVTAGCSPAVPGARSADERALDRAEEELRRRVADEDGWVVLELANLHEGGGTTTWWLHPCNPDSDDTRDVTRTAYHGSDVATLPGHHTVETDQLDCAAPSPDLHVGDRHLRLDTDAVRLGRSQFALTGRREQVEVTDVAHDTRTTVERLAQPSYGPCDGRTAWSATLPADNQLTVHEEGCVGRLAALPDDALELLDLPADGHPQQMSSAELDDDRHHRFLTALHDAGFDTDTSDLLDHDDPQLSSLWYGPCGPSPNDRHDDETHTFVDVHAGHVVVTERPCG